MLLQGTILVYDKYILENITVSTRYGLVTTGWSYQGLPDFLMERDGQQCLFVPVFCFAVKSNF
jgi:hypothetical protein